MLTAVRLSPLTKGQFILYDKVSKQPFPSCTWTFLYNPEELVNEMNANISQVKYSGQNWSSYYTNGIDKESYKMKLALTGDNRENKGNSNVPAPTPAQVIGEISYTTSPLQSSSVGSNPTIDVPNIFAQFGRRNMIYHIEHLKSLMLKDPGYEWRILFNYGNIVPGGAAGFPNCFILNSLTATHMVCSADLNATILATVEVELIVDANASITRAQYLSLFKERQKIYG